VRSDCIRKIDREPGHCLTVTHFCKPANRKSETTQQEFASPTPLLSLHGLAHSVHDFGVAGGLRRPYVSVHPRLPDKDKTAHSSRRSRQTGKMLVVLRDGRKLFGVLRSYDQFGAHDAYRPSLFFCVFARTERVSSPLLLLPPLSANLVLEDTVERIYHQDVFAEQWVGLFLIRGENVVLLGEIVSAPKALLPSSLRVRRSGVSLSRFLTRCPCLSGS
jgi:small nuclear ribonucleoprotein (snRNP)-like protein